jgi:hypothetical protein
LVNTLTMFQTVKNIRHVVSQVFSLSGFLLSAGFPGVDIDSASESITRTLEAVMGWFEATDDRLRSEALAGAGQILRYVGSSGLKVDAGTIEVFEGYVKGDIGGLGAGEKELLGMWDVTEDLFEDSDDEVMEEVHAVIDLTNLVDTPKKENVKYVEPLGKMDRGSVPIGKNYAVRDREVRDSWMVCNLVNDVDYGQGCQDGEEYEEETHKASFESEENDIDQRYDGSGSIYGASELEECYAAYV